ncbi:hypothetical protein V6N11_057361 [Hibiscus sabdariffa]|uniref:Uncharacterized protein n=2 Tax=Hibiscus sabdariffa TaxID=183260 RepID=A0ABR2N9K9_9ROSI
MLGADQFWTSLAPYSGAIVWYVEWLLDERRPRKYDSVYLLVCLPFVGVLEIRRPEKVNESAQRTFRLPSQHEAFSTHQTAYNPCVLIIQVVAKVEEKLPIETLILDLLNFSLDSLKGDPSN